MSDKKICFVIAPIGEEESEIRKRSDQVLKYIIEPAVNEYGYNPIRADQISEPGLITSQMIQHIIDSPLVIADLTGRNPNVFYELAIRHAIRKPLIQIIEKGEQIPFDVAGTRTISVNYRDLDSVANAKAEINRQIRAVTKDPSRVYSPISMALDLRNMRSSDNLEQRSLADIIEGVSEIQTGILNIQSDLASESVLQNKYDFRDISLIVENIKRLTDSIRHQWGMMQKWILSETELDDDSLRERKMVYYEVMDTIMSLYKISDELEVKLNLRRPTPHQP